MPWVGSVLGKNGLEYEFSWVRTVLGTSWPGPGRLHFRSYGRLLS